MPRQPRVVAVGVPHPITQRGNNRQLVFSSDADRLSYLDTLRRKCRDYGLDVFGRRLMPTRQDSMAKALGKTHHTYALRFDRLRSRSGHLWQNRFYSRPLGPTHLIEAFASVDLNPVRARLTDRPEAYHWSSVRAHTTHSDSTALLDA